MNSPALPPYPHDELADRRQSRSADVSPGVAVSLSDGRAKATPGPDGSWFADARYGLFIHFGPYAEYARGEQVLVREMLDQRAYAEKACAWNPTRFDAGALAREAVAGGFRYAVLTTRHHDGYCLWDTRTTNYSSARQAPKRDLVAEYVSALRAAGLRVGLYYSWADMRLPALYAGPALDPLGWAALRDYVHAQVEELLTGYGEIDQFWFDQPWPRTAVDWESERLVARMRALQPDMLINNRLGDMPGEDTFDATRPVVADELGLHGSADRGDFGTPEHHITAQPGRLWESCQVTTWRLWSHTTGDRWRGADQWLDMLTEAACKGGNLLLNVGPLASGELPPEFIARNRAVGEWLRVHGEAIYGTDLQPVDVCETTLLGGRQIRRGNTLYIILRFWHGGGEVRLAGLEASIQRATLLGCARELTTSRDSYGVTVRGLPPEPTTALFPVLKLECAEPPRALPTYNPQQQWAGDPMRYHGWAMARGTSFDV
jgi:alpha-L-fucosidase